MNIFKKIMGWDKIIFKRREPKFAKNLPYKMGAGGWPVEEPTHEELSHFLELLNVIPAKYFGPEQNNTSPDYGTDYTSVIKVRQWLKLIRDENLFEKEK